jgi:hypothetical protein
VSVRVRFVVVVMAHCVGEMDVVDVGGRKHIVKSRTHSVIVCAYWGVSALCMLKMWCVILVFIVRV